MDQIGAIVNVGAIVDPPPAASSNPPPASSGFVNISPSLTVPSPSKSWPPPLASASAVMLIWFVPLTYTSTTPPSCPPLSLGPLKKVIYLCELVILILLNISWGHFQKVGGMSGILVSYTRDSRGEGFKIIFFTKLLRVKALQVVS